MRFRKFLFLPLCWFLAIFLLPSVQAQNLAGSYIQPEHLTALPFGSHSHWLQPWRAYQETVSAKQFLNGIGINFDFQDVRKSDPVLKMLSKYGMRHIRIEVNWSSVNWDDETLLNNATDLRVLLLSCQRYGLRPLFLLNAHSGFPCPTQFFTRTLASPANKGATSVKLTDVTGLKTGYSGFCNLTSYCASEVLITAITGNKVTLSKPLPVALGGAGASVNMSTLKYRPFSNPTSTDYANTMRGWQRYVATLARFAAATLRTSGQADPGFDMEIWNELNFASNFLYINYYYQKPLTHYDERSIWRNLVKTTADYATRHPELFRGVRFCDGFGNTIPWPASSQEPTRVTALSAHPYASRQDYPLHEEAGGMINSRFTPDTSGFIPNYSVSFPEFYATGLQTETVIRNMAPITNTIYGVKHGRYARVSGGKVLPCWQWFSECGYDPRRSGIADPQMALSLKGKTAARIACLFLNKGVERLYFFSAASGDISLGIVQDSFLTYARTGSAYPVNDAPYVSPALQVLGRITAKMSESLDTNLTTLRPVAVASLSDTHNHAQFTGDGTPEHPTLYNREVFTILPYQVNARRFILPYYVMTRDVTQPFAPEQYTVTLNGLKGTGASVTAYDPINDVSVPVTVNSASDTSLTLTLSVADYPYLLTIQEL